MSNMESELYIWKELDQRKCHAKGPITVASIHIDLFPFLFFSCLGFFFFFFLGYNSNFTDPM